MRINKLQELKCPKQAVTDSISSLISESSATTFLFRWVRPQLGGCEHSVINEVFGPLLRTWKKKLNWYWCKIRRVVCRQTCGSVDGGHGGCLKRRTVDIENWTFKNKWTDRYVFIFQQTEPNCSVSHNVWCWSKAWMLSGTTRPNTTSVRESEVWAESWPVLVLPDR